MFFRKVTVSEECMGWLKKSSMLDVTAEEAKMKYGKVCNEIQEAVLHTITTESKEPASADGKAEIVVEVKLVKAVTLQLMMVVTRVYAVVYTSPKKKYYVFLDANRELKKASKINNDLMLHVNGGDFIDFLDTIENKAYRISM